eukprot:1162049-Pelagomonas_calceolata.AAC.5
MSCTWRWGHAGSRLGSSSSASRFSTSWDRAGGSVRNRFWRSMKEMSSDTASVNLPVPLFA